MEKNKFPNLFIIITFAIYFFSGACSLTYEIIWQRLLKLVLGNTTYATSITVTVFMGGLALGAFLIRKKADRFKNRLFVYGVIEMLISLFALITPLLLKGIDLVYIHLYHSINLPPVIVLSLQVIISSIILLLPTILIGTTLPVLAGIVVHNAECTGRRTGILYSINTFGALAGVSLTGFYTIRLLGVFPAYYIMIGLNVFIGIVSILLSRWYRSETSEKNIPNQNTINKSTYSKKGLRTALFIWLFIMGFVALGYEIIWIRTVVHLLKAEIYTFSSVLCVYLFGYAIGVFAGSCITKRSSQTLTSFYFITPLIGLCGILYLTVLTHVVDNQFLWNYKLLKYLLGIFGYLPHLYLCTIFFFLPSFFMGICFPILVQAVRNLGGNTGDTISKAYGFNTLGSVFGPVITGFILIPFLGVQKSMLLLGFAATLSGVSALLFIRKTPLILAGTILPAVSLIIALMQPKDIFPKWINKCEGKGTYQVKLIDFIEGITTTASVHKYSDGSTVISTAGINVAGDPLPLRQTQKMQGHFPIILHGNARSVCTVGFGTGELTKTLTFHNIPDITCVEISPEMVKLSKKYFSRINLGNGLEKYVHMVYMDGKNFFHLTNKKFDVIENDCIWPGTFAESSALYTKEYFEDAKRCLNEDGVFSTWLTLDLPPSTLLSIIKTFSSVFQNTLFIYPNFTPDRHILLLGQKNEHQYRYGDAMKDFRNEKVKESLSLIGIRNLNDVLGSILADNSSLDRFTENSIVNSDYFPFVEFDMNRSQLIDNPSITWQNLKMMLQNTQRVDYKKLLSFEGLDSTTCNTILNELNLNKDANDYLLESFCVRFPEERISLIKKGLTIAPENQGLLRMTQLLKGE